MIFKQFIGLSLYKSSCILFACTFFVSCNTVDSKPTEVISAAGNRNIASAAMTSINSSAFLVMQDCPVLSSIQSRVQTFSNSEQIMGMMEEKDSQGRTLAHRLMQELSSSAGCFTRVIELKRDMCSHNTYTEICENLDQLEELGADAVRQEFESFIGGSIDSVPARKLILKIGEFINSDSINNLGTAVSLFKKIKDKIAEHREIAYIIGILLIGFLGYKALITVGTLAISTFALASASALIAIGAAIAIIFLSKKVLSN